MKNPIQKMNIFATPDSSQALTDYIELIPQPERGIAYTVMGMTWNLCSEFVTHALKSNGESPLKRLVAYRESDFDSLEEARADGAVYETELLMTDEQLNSMRPIYEGVMKAALDCVGYCESIKLELVSAQ